MPFMEITTLKGDELKDRATKSFKGLMRAYGVIVSIATVFYGALLLFEFALATLFGEALPFPGVIFIAGGIGLLALGGILVFYIFFVNKRIFDMMTPSPSENPYSSLHASIPLPSRSIGDSIVDKLDLPTAPTLVAIFVGALVLSSIMVLIGGWVTIAALPIVFMCITSPCLMWISYAYSKDIYEPEPARSVLMALGWGMMSCIPSLIMNTTVSTATNDMFITAAIGAPLIEEFWKPLGLYFVRKDIDDELDGVIYGMSCGMGFAMLENFHYASRSLIAAFYTPGTPSGYGLLVVMRSVTSIVGHMVGPACIGYGYAVYLKWKNNGGLTSTLDAPEKFSIQSSPQAQSIPQMSAVPQAQDAPAVHAAPASLLDQYAMLRIPMGYGIGVIFHFIWNGSLTVISGLGTSANLCMLCLVIACVMVGVPVGEMVLLRYLMHLGMKINIEKYAEKAKGKLPPSYLSALKKRLTSQPAAQPQYQYPAQYPSPYSQYPQPYIYNYYYPYSSYYYIPPPDGYNQAGYAPQQYGYTPQRQYYSPPQQPNMTPSQSISPPQQEPKPAKYDNPLVNKK